MTDMHVLEQTQASREAGIGSVASMTRTIASAGAGSDGHPIDGSSGAAKARRMAAFASMPVALHVRIPLPSFKLHSLAQLRVGSVVTTGWSSSEDLPVTAGEVRLAWAEFAIADHKRSVRVTRIS